MNLLFFGELNNFVISIYSFMVTEIGIVGLLSNSEIDRRNIILSIREILSESQFTKYLEYKSSIFA